ncbi:MAG: hypothetical protein AUH85_14830 [Chloroflexi bacterium 13_1_40CM_4_68_4]|nr:MAG: hypothetical protein AUH85_14830 [Chloroflexi bacterium 13_1_40CM_4_68_4]
MVGTLVSVIRSGLLFAAVLVVVLILGAGLAPDGQTILYASVWITTLLVVAVGAFLVRGQRPIAGAGAILCAVAGWLPFFWHTPPSGIVWTVGLIVGVALIAYGSRQDVAMPLAIPLLFARFVVGWAFVDNASNDQTWLPAGGGFLSSATASAARAPLDFVDPAYHSFLSGVVIPHPGTWAGMFLSGELAFGLLLAVGLFTPLAAWGTMWLSANIILQKSFITHGTFQDKTYFVLEFVALVTAAGYAYGLDAALHRFLPVRWDDVLTGATRAMPGVDRPRPAPMPGT